MNLLALYLLLLKATITSFSGLGSLPLVRSDFVVKRHLLTDHELNTAVVAGRAGPGPFGLYLVCIGYKVDGVPGGAAALLALITPAFLVLPMMHWLGQHANAPRIRDGIRGLLLGSAGLLLASSVPLAQDAIKGPLTLAIVILSFFVLTFTRLDTAWLIVGAAAVGLAAKLLS
jgi:chromate transporter